MGFTSKMYDYNILCKYHVMKTEQTKRTETSAHKIQTSGNHPKKQNITRLTLRVV
jgi:hypothetical protein